MKLAVGWLLMDLIMNFGASVGFQGIEANFVKQYRPL